MYKKSIKHIIILTIFLLIFTTISIGQTAVEMKQSQQFEQNAIANYKEKNYSEFLRNMLGANKFRSNHPRLIYNLAIAFNLNDDKVSALKNLQNLAKMGLYFPIQKDEDFKTLFDSAEFREIQKNLNQNISPVNKSQKAFSLEQKDLITEGIAYNPNDKRFFISSIHKRKIVSIDSNNKVSDFSKESDGLWSVSGMKVDEKRQILWVSTTAFPQMRDFDEKEDGKSGIFKYDLKTGTLLKKYLLSNETEKHALGDLTINKNGDVFATDSVSPNIYFIDAKKDSLELFLENDSFFSLQGLTFSADEKYLFVADYSKGISKIDVKTKKIQQLLPSENITVLGIDGLYFYKENLIAIQNGVNPNRVIRLKLDKSYSMILSFETLEANHESFNEPTLGLIIGTEFYFIANSQWNLINEKGEFKAQKLQKPQILKLGL
jgi:WD40 repeat protein